MQSVRGKMLLHVSAYTKVSIEFYSNREICMRKVKLGVFRLNPVV